MQRVRVLALVVAAIGAASGCDQGNVCDLVDYELPPPVNVVIRDQAGTPAALGSVVTFGGGGRQLRDSTLSDTLTISGGAYNTVYGILVTRPFYASATFDSVSLHATYDDCHKPKTFDLPVTLSVTLTLLPNAPRVRSFYLVSNMRSTTLDRGGQDSLKVEPWLDADASVSRAVTWRLSGDTASLSFNLATGVASFRCRPTSGLVHVTARATADTSITASLSLYVQGHPANPTDLPCS